MLSSFWKLLPVLTLGFCVGAQAQELDLVSKAPDPQKKQKPKEIYCGVDEGRNCCFARGCAGGYGVALEIDFLWWRAENHGFSFAYNQTSANYFGTFSPMTSNTGRIERVHPKWNPGVRVGAGWNSNYDRWDVFADWTWYSNHSRKTRAVTATAPSFQGFYPIYPVGMSEVGGGLYTPYQRVHGSYHMWYNAFNLELGRAFYITKHLALRPNLGGQAGWINQRFKSNFNFPLQTNPMTFPEFDFHGQNNCWGVGPRLGLNANWEIGYGFSVLGKAATSLLYGRTKALFQSEYLLSGAPNFITANKITDSFYQLTPTMQLFFGVQWGGCVDYCRGIWFGIDAGWESNVWWNQFNIPTAINSWTAPLPTTCSQPVTMEGLTINTHLDF